MQIIAKSSVQDYQSKHEGVCGGGGMRNYKILSSPKILITFIFSVKTCVFDFFVDPFCFCVSCVSVILSCLFLAILWSHAGKGLISWLSCF